MKQNKHLCKTVNEYKNKFNLMDFNWFFNEVFNVYIKKDKINSTFICHIVCVYRNEKSEGHTMYRIFENLNWSRKVNFVVFTLKKFFLKKNYSFKIVNFAWLNNLIWNRFKVVFILFPGFFFLVDLSFMSFSLCYTLTYSSAKHGKKDFWSEPQFSNKNF